MPSPMDLTRTWYREGVVPHDAPALLARSLAASPGGGVNAADPGTGQTALHYACHLQSVPAIRALIDAPGAQANKPDSEGALPLNLLLEGQSQQRSPDTFSQIISLAVELARRAGSGTVDKQGNSPLSLALYMCANLGAKYTERRLLDELVKGVDVTKEIVVKRDTSRTTPMICVLLKRADLLRRVLDFANPAPNLHATDKNGMTALHLAGKMGDWGSGRMIAETDPSVCRVKDDNGNIALFYFVTVLPPRELLNMIDSSARFWDFDSLNSLEENVIDYFDRCLDNKKFDNATKLSVKKALWAKGDKLVYKHNKKAQAKRPLVSSVIKEAIHVIELRQRGSVPAARDAETHVQPLHLCLDDMKTVATLVSVLCETGDQLTMNVCDGRGYTPLMICAKYGLHEEAEAMAMSRPGPEVNKVNGNGDTALHMAARCGKVAVTYTLLRWPGIQKNAQDVMGNTPLFYILERFPRNESINVVANFKGWNFKVTNNKLELPGDYFLHASSSSRHANTSASEKADEKKLVELLNRWQSIHGERERMTYILNPPKREPTERSWPDDRSSGTSDSGLSDQSRDSCSSSASERDSRGSRDSSLGSDTHPKVRRDALPTQVSAEADA